MPSSTKIRLRHNGNGIFHLKTTIATTLTKRVVKMIPRKNLKVPMMILPMTKSTIPTMCMMRTTRRSRLIHWDLNRAMERLDLVSLPLLALLDVIRLLWCGKSKVLLHCAQKMFYCCHLIVNFHYVHLYLFLNCFISVELITRWMNVWTSDNNLCKITFAVHGNEYDEFIKPKNCSHR